MAQDSVDSMEKISSKDQHVLNEFVKGMRGEKEFLHISTEEVENLGKEGKILLIVVDNDKKGSEGTASEEGKDNFVNYPWRYPYMYMYGAGGWPPGLYTRMYDRYPPLYSVPFYYPGRFSFYYPYGGRGRISYYEEFNGGLNGLARWARHNGTLFYILP